MGDTQMALVNLDIEYIIQTRFFFRTEYVFIPKLDLQTYLEACGRKFAINFDCKQNVYLYNQNFAEIPANRFHQIISMYWRDAFFCVNLVADSIKSDTADITLKDLQTFLIQRHCGEILERGKNKDAQISEEDRKLLIKNAFAYISAKFHQVQKFHIVLLAKTLVSLVPCLTDSSEGEYSGFGLTLGFLLKKSNNFKYNQKVAEKKRTDRASGNKKRNSGKSGARKSSGAGRNKSVPNEPAFEKELEYFKSVVVNDQNMKTIELKLKSTAVERMKMIHNKKMDFLENFPFFFTHPKLILYDFTVHFPKVDPDALTKEWPDFASRIKDILKEHYNITVSTGWSEDIEQFLALLRVLPAKATKYANSVVPFIQAIDKLIVHSEVKPVQKELNKNVHPHIIACGPTKESLTHYYIAFENHLVPLLVGCNFIQVIDVLFKIHMVFNTRFEYNIAPMMKFIGHYIFQMETKEFEPLLRARNLYKHFSKQENQ